MRTGVLDKYIDRLFNGQMSAVAADDIELTRKLGKSFLKSGDLYIDSALGRGKCTGCADLNRGSGIGVGHTVLLCHFDGNNAATSYTADTGQIATFYGNAKIDGNYRVFGPSSIYFDGTGDYITFPDSVNWHFGNEDFTVDCWIRLGSVAVEHNIVAQFVDVNNLWRIDCDGTRWEFQVTLASVQNRMTASWSPVINVWYHFAFVRYGDVCTFYVNGKAIGTKYMTFLMPDFASVLYVGQNGNSAGYINGNVDELRIVKGAAVYTSDFNPSTIQYDLVNGSYETEVINFAEELKEPDIYTVLLLQGNGNDQATTVIDETGKQITNAEVYDSPTVLMLHMNGTGNTFIDSATNKTITANGNVTQSTTQKRFGVSSAYFDGSGDYLSLANSTDWDFGTGDFTIDFWLNIETMENDESPLSACYDNGANKGWVIGGGGALTLWNTDWTLGVTSGVITSLYGSWHHFAVVRSGNSVQWYIDGVASGSAGNATGKTYNSAGFGLYLGRFYISISNYYLNAYMDEVRISKGIARWTSTFIPPKSQYGTVNTITNDKKFGTSCLEFKGGGEYLSLKDSDDWYFSDKDFTIDFWIKLTCLTVGTDYQGICNQMYDGNHHWKIRRNADGTLLINHLYDGVFGGLVYTGAGALNDLNWHHVAFVRSGSTVYIFVDGVSQGVTTSPSYGTNDVGRIGALYNTDLHIGVNDVFSTPRRLNGYLDSFRITKGLARWTSDFTPTMSEIVYEQTKLFTPTKIGMVLKDDITAKTVLLMHMNGANNATSFIEENGKTVTAVGTAKISTARAKFGSSSLFCDGSGARITLADSTDWDLGLNDFTIEFWVNFNAVSNAQSIISQYLDGSNFWQVTKTNNGNLVFEGIATPSNFNVTSSILPWINNVWYHIAVVRKDGTVTLYRDGTSVKSGIVSCSFNNIATVLTIGAAGAVGNSCNAYIDEVRIINGAAMYDCDFVPSSVPFDIAGVSTRTTNPQIDQYTKLLLHFDGPDTGTRFLDECGHTITAYGNAQYDTAQTKFGPSSLLLDGTGDYLTVIDSDDWNFGTGDFTIDVWVRFNSVSVDQVIVGHNDGTNYFAFYMTSTGFLRFDGGSTVGLSWSVGSSKTFSTNTWYHLAFVKHGNIGFIFVDGIQVARAGIGNLTNVSGDLYVGGYGPSGSNLYFNGWIDELRISKGIARWVEDFTRPVVPHTLNLTSTIGNDTGRKVNRDQYTVFLCHCEAESTQVSSGQIIDECGHITRAYGNATISTAQSKFGKSSLYFDGSGDYVLVNSSDDWQFLNDNFTIDMWLNVSSQPALNTTMVFMSLYETANNQRCIQLDYRDSAGVKSLNFYGSNDGSTTPTNLRYNVTLTLSQWYHFALTREGSFFKMYLNGALVGSIAAIMLFPYSCQLMIGGNVPSSPQLYYNGYIDEIRISKGIARWTSNFTPPAQQYDIVQSTVDVSSVEVQLARDVDDKTVLLLHCDEDGGVSGGSARVDLQDETGKVVHFNGGVSFDRYNKKFGVGSYKFNGSSGYLSLVDSEDWWFGNGNFTIDMWFYISVAPTSPSRYGLMTQFIDSSNAVSVHIHSDRLVQFACVGAGMSGTVNIYSVTPATLNVWNHVAFVRSGNTFYNFLNGVLQSTVVRNGILTNVSAPLYIGRGYDGGADPYYMNGNIDEVRVSKGVARWTSDFTIPTAPYVLQTYKTLTLQQTKDGIYRTTELVDITDLPAGSNFKAKVNFNNNTPRRIQGIGLYAK